MGDLQSLPKSTLTQVITGGPGGNRQYIEHTYEGGFEGQLGGASWTFTWTAPSTDMGPVRLYAAGNQADGDFDNTGDQIYLAQATINPNAGWVSITSGTTGIGDAAVGYTVAANPGGRKATIAIAGWTFRIKQKAF